MYLFCLVVLSSLSTCCLLANVFTHQLTFKHSPLSIAAFADRSSAPPDSRRDVTKRRSVCRRWMPRFFPSLNFSFFCGHVPPPPHNFSRFPPQSRRFEGKINSGCAKPDTSKTERSQFSRNFAIRLDGGGSAGRSGNSKNNREKKIEFTFRPRSSARKNSRGFETSACYDDDRPARRHTAIAKIAYPRNPWMDASSASVVCFILIESSAREKYESLNFQRTPPPILVMAHQRR